MTTDSGKTLGKSILVVEDQEALRKAICLSLARSGYVVHEAENGVKALEFLKGKPTAVDLIITDVVMPEMGGHELAKSLSAAGIKTKLLFLSGYTEGVLVDHGLTGAHPEFLGKPFSKHGLLEKVKALLS